MGGWWGGGSLEQAFQVHVDSHTPPPRRRNHIQRHTQQTGWRSPSLQPFLGTPLPSAPPLLVWGLLKRGAPMEGALLACMWDLCVCICVWLWRLNPTVAAGWETYAACYGHINGVLCFTIKARECLYVCCCFCLIIPPPPLISGLCRRF